MLSQEVIRELSTGGEKEYIFDFSLVPSERYEQLFRTLQKFCVSPNVEIIGFNCDAITQHKGDARLPPEIAGSVAKRKKSYVRNIVELLCFCVPKSKYITKICFSNLTFSHEYFTRLCKSFSNSNSLKHFIVKQCSIQDSSVDSLFRLFDPNKIETVILNNCSLSSSVITSAVAFARRKTVPQDEGIKIISLTGNEIPSSELQKVENALHPTQEKPELIRKPVRQEEPAVEEYENETPEAEGYRLEIESLRNENQMLRNQIKALREMKASAELNGSIFVVGTGSPQFVSYLSEIEEKLLEIDQNTRFMPLIQ